MIYNELIKLSNDLGCKIFENEPLSKYTSFKIGGPANILIDVQNIDSLRAIIKKVTVDNIPFFVIGNGSNLLVSDSGYNGVILRLIGDFKKIRIDNNKSNIIECGTGASLARACVFALKNNLSGLEFAWGIPGTCGGAIFMNAGAYGGEISHVITESTHVTPDGNIGTFNNQEMHLSYRRSVYSKNSFIISSIKLKLSPGNHDEIKNNMNDCMSKRRNKQPLEFPSAGSIFKRPPGNFAGTLIEKCGLKGKKIGGAMVSTKHAGFIINAGDATCKDVLNLIEHIKNTVYNQSGILLECEVKILGDV